MHVSYTNILVYSTSSTEAACLQPVSGELQSNQMLTVHLTQAHQSYATQIHKAAESHRILPSYKKYITRPRGAWMETLRASSFSTWPFKRRVTFLWFGWVPTCNGQSTIAYLSISCLQNIWRENVTFVGCFYRSTYARGGQTTARGARTPADQFKRGPPNTVLCTVFSSSIFPTVDSSATALAEGVNKMVWFYSY